MKRNVRLRSKEVQNLVDIYSQKAERMLENDYKMLTFSEKVENWVKKKMKLPALWPISYEVHLSASLIKDYALGDYMKISYLTIVAVTAAMLYLITPFDLIMDATPVIGYLDDLEVMRAIMESGIDKKLQEYRIWKGITKKEIKNKKIKRKK